MPPLWGILAGIGVVLVLTIALYTRTVFMVDETEQVIVLRFGEVQRVITEPGRYSKAPWDSTIYYDKRALLVDAPVQPMPDRDHKFLEIDIYGHYRITAPVQFLRSFGDEYNARDRLSQIINAALRDEVVTRRREEILGDPPGSAGPGTGTTTVYADTRAEVLEKVLEEVNRRLAQEQGDSLGIEMVDLEIRQAAYLD